MEYKDEIDFYDLECLCWSGALNTLSTIKANNKEEELISLLEEIFFYDKIPTLTQINNFLWFDDKYIYEVLDIERND